MHTGWTSEDSPDEAQLSALGEEMSDRIFAVNGKFYTSQKSIGLYPTSGTASDWYERKPNKPQFKFICDFLKRFYSDNANENNGDYHSAGFTIELRDDGQYGFLLPPDQVIIMLL